MTLNWARSVAQPVTTAPAAPPSVVGFEPSSVGKNTHNSNCQVAASDLQPLKVIGILISCCKHASLVTRRSGHNSGIPEGYPGEQISNVECTNHNTNHASTSGGAGDIVTVPGVEDRGDVRASSDQICAVPSAISFVDVVDLIYN